ncbi:type VI secretion system-associated protein TagF [Rhodanobacter ginsengiterrae]|uniref:type VI secretion system-associated protein TagF n=1 Tax=Rhodanobacter ginsengiterrae TaxID=2008451 RepID=UPI003CF88E60
MPNPVAGFFGKLPCAGDFVQRRLPSAFVDVWDGHFEGAVAESRAELGAGWHDAYHASPVWRFLLAPGICGDAAWLGIMGPGVDRVGRCFPMVIAAPLAADIATGTRALTEAKAWFDAAEQVHAAAQADARINVEVFDDQVAALGEPLATSSSQASTSLRDVDWSVATHWRLPLPAVSSPANFLSELWERLTAGAGPWCLWWTAGGERVPACALATRGLPASAAYAAFLDAGHGLAAWQSPLAFERSRPPQPLARESAASLLDDLTIPTLVARPPTSPAPTVATPAAATAWLPDDPDLLSDLVASPQVSTLSQPVASNDPVAMGKEVDAAMVVAASAAVVARTDCALTVACAEVGVVDPRQRAVAEVSGIIRTMSCSDLIGGMQSLRRQLLMLNPPLRRASEDLIDPVLEDCAVIAAHVSGGQASLLRIGMAGAWHCRHGRLQPLFAQADDPLPGGAGDGEFDDLLFSRPEPSAPGLGAAEQPLWGEVRCELQPGDRLLLMAGPPLLQLSPDILASALALPSVDEARLRLAPAAGLGLDAARWPLTIIETGA